MMLRTFGALFSAATLCCCTPLHEGPVNAPRQSLEEPRRPIATDSAEAAGQVIQLYGALIEAKKWREAALLWGDLHRAGAFAAGLEGNRENHLEIGNLSPIEGAAGSLYVSMPVTFYGVDAAGRPFRDPATIIVRRINDVPGSTEAQRRWHIERIEQRAAT